MILIPAIGGLVVGFMIHYWEPTLKGHGIPEAMEAVLFGHSRMRIRVAILKPLATAFAIGTGGPFGAEGPIIQTGAAIGSLFGQWVGLTPYYRRVLLASGAAAGMAATFTAPLAGILVAIELHVFPHLVSDPAFYALVAMAAVFGGIARAPFTSIVFLFELSHNPNSLLPLIVCVMISDGFVRLFSRDSIMTVKLVKRGLIVLQDYSVPVLMRARIDQVMHKKFETLQADAELRNVLKTFSPTDMGLIPIVEKDGTLVGILDAHDLLRIEPPDHHFKMRELARQDYVLAYPGESVDQVHRDMMLKNIENVVVVESSGERIPMGIARANDILQLRRWLMEEETREPQNIIAQDPVVGSPSEPH